MMKKILKNWMRKAFLDAENCNKENILNLCKEDKDAILLDLGCDDGSWTKIISKKICAKKTFGVEIDNKRAETAKKKGIEVFACDLNKRLPFKNSEFNVVHANQVIEHLSNIPNFVSEIARIVKPNGYVLVSTENGSSWHNIFASICGYQIFSCTNITEKAYGLGNPYALHRHSENPSPSDCHKTILNFRGFLELFEFFGFGNIVIKGAGYYPMPASFGRIDPRHAHFITMKAYKQ